MPRATPVPSSKRLRYKPNRGYARGDAARQRLIAAGLELFGRHGFDGASTRDIAAAAGLNAPSLQYYFNNKRGLYLACAQSVVAAFWTAMRDVVIAAERLLAERASDQALVDAFCAMWSEFGEFLGVADEGLFLLVARDQSGREPDAVFEGTDRRVQRLSRAAVAIIGRLLDLPPGSAECALRAASLSGPLWVFYFMRRSVLRALRRRELGSTDAAMIKRITAEHTRACLNAMIAARSRARRSPR
jgi:AcrR family transcriptional regulator